jgi:LSD1 subclass zinc finger protein
MKSESSRRVFLASGMALPVVAAGMPVARPSASSLPGPAASFAAAPEVKYRVLGKTGLKVSSVGFGCMITSDPSVIVRAADMGINLFDTARVYGGGNNERMVAAALKDKRKQVIISTKSIAKTKADAETHLATSLRELGTDYIDIWYLHNRTNGSEITDELLEVQQAAKKAGKIRFAGVSTHAGHDSVFAVAIKSKKVDVILTTYNFAMNRQTIEPLIKSATDAGIGVVAMKVMAGSIPLPDITASARERMKQPGVALAALKWTLRNPNVVAIPSMTDADQLEQNFTAMAAPLSQAEEKLLAAQSDYIRPLYCRMCGKCEGTCPQGLPVADMLRILTYADGYGQFPLARERFLELPSSARSVRCKLCPTCSVSCPNGVQVRTRLARAQELFA